MSDCPFYPQICDRLDYLQRLPIRIPFAADRPATNVNFNEFRTVEFFIMQNYLNLDSVPLALLLTEHAEAVENRFSKMHVCITRVGH